MIDLQPLLQQMIARWQTEDIPNCPGVNSKKIAEFESRNGVKLPQDMREYFSTINGMGDHYDEDFFRFWPLEEIKSTAEYVPELIEAFPESAGYFFFFDCSIDLFMYAIRLNDSETSPTPIAHVFPQRDGISFDPFCGSLSEFFTMYVTNPRDLM
jgi:SMI1 / KNR4 family (SUKH-1)